MEEYKLIDMIRECAYRVRLDLAPGYLESVYQNALIVQLMESGLKVEKEKEISIIYHGHCIGNFRSDIIVDNKIILELKATIELSAIHEMQLVNYLNITGINTGILINFGAERFRFIPKFRTKELLNKYNIYLQSKDNV